MVAIGGLSEPWDHLFPLVTDYDSRRRLASRSGNAPLDAEQDLSWPQFSGREMSDLLAFLNNRLVSRMGKPEIDNLSMGSS